MGYVTLGGPYFKDLYTLADDIKNARAMAGELQILVEYLCDRSQKVWVPLADDWVKRAHVYSGWLYAAQVHRPYSILRLIRLSAPPQGSGRVIFKIKVHNGYLAPFVLPDNGENVLDTVGMINAKAKGFVGLNMKNVRIKTGAWLLPDIEVTRAALSAEVNRIAEATDVLTRILDTY